MMFLTSSLPLLFSYSNAGEQLGEMGLAEFYGQTPWASVHRDSRNSDFSPLVTSSKIRVDWSILDGAALINPGVIDAEGNHYLTSGRGPGFSHLHAFNSDGVMLWESPVQKGDDDLDALAGFNSPVIDANGDIYVGDGNQFWAYRATGELKWVSPLPARDVGRPFVYQIISKQGFVGGITVDGTVLFYEPDDGSLAVPVFRLPKGVAPPQGPALPGLWAGGLFHDSVIELFKQIAFGYKVQVANAPAVHPETGRIFITAAGPKEDEAYSGVLYGLDVKADAVEIAFATRMGGGSGTSPALSADGRFVYSADGEGRMLAVYTDTGEVAWAAKGEGLLSPAIADDGKILTGNIFSAPTVIARSPKDGSSLWARSYDDYAATVLPTLEPHAPEFPDGKPVARLVSVISASSNTVWVGMNLGYDYHQPNSALVLPVPHKSVVCALRVSDGELLHCVNVRDTNEGMIKIGTAGRLYVSHTSIFGSFFYYGLNSQLPKRYRSPLQPTGGLTAMRPVSYCDQFKLEIQELLNIDKQLKTAMKQNNIVLAREKVSRYAIQLNAFRDTLRLAKIDIKEQHDNVNVIHENINSFKRALNSADNSSIKLNKLITTSSEKQIKDLTGSCKLQ